MSVYQLTHTEAWALVTILHLPVQPGSALADWLLSASEPGVDVLWSSTTWNGLAAKGYYRGSEATVPFDEGLLRALTLISINAALITALIRTNGHAALARFAQAGESYVQVGMDETHLAVHPVRPVRYLAQTLLPDWFTVSYNEARHVTLPLGAFVLFKHACNLADWAFVRSGFQQQSFPAQELLESFPRIAGWMDVFNAAGVRDVPAVAELPLENYLNVLVARDYLTIIDRDFLAVGSAGKPLAAALTAPESCTLTLTLQTWEGNAVPCGVFLHGAGRLFLLEFVSGQVYIRQLGNLVDAQSWIKKLIEEGGRAHYAEYLIPSVTADGDLQRVRVATAPAPVVAPTPQVICPECRLPLAADMRFCPNCGAQQDVDYTGTTLDMSDFAPASVPTVVIGARHASWGKLIVQNGPLAKREFPLGESLRVGRGTDNDLVLPDGKASRYHAIIERKGQDYQITDLGSSNGTLVNDRRIAAPTTLADGDRILIGDTQMIFLVQS